jgi:hypothetical protein
VSESAAPFTADQIEAIIEQTYENVGLFVRDTEVAPEHLAKYQPGLIFREKGLTYASYRVGGQAANCRYVIFSNHMYKKEPDLSNYGLCLANKGAVFQVLGRLDRENGAWVILLHLPGDDYWRAFEGFESPVNADMVKSCQDFLQEMTKKPPIPELLNEEWVDTCKYPLGIDDNGEFFPL